MPGLQTDLARRAGEGPREGILMSRLTRLLPGFSLLFTLLLPSLSSAVTCNGEIVNGRMPNIPNPAYPDYWQFGSHVYARTHISSTDCDYHATKNAYTGTYSIYPTGETSDVYHAATHGSDTLGRPIDLISNVSALQSQFGASLYALRRNYGTTNADGSLGDILWLDKPGAASDEITDIPVEYCFSYDSMWASTAAPTASAGNSLVQFGKFNYNGYASQDSYDLDTQLTAADIGPGGGKICTSGYLRMTGPGAGYTVRLSFNLTGQSGNELDPGTGTYMVTIEGGISSDLQITSLPSGVTCASASGVFPGCDRQNYCDITPLNDFGDDNITFSDQTQDIDYASEDLVFLRTHGTSNNTFGSSSGEIGNNWSHSYSRSFNIKESVNNVTAELINESGNRRLFRKNYNGAWISAQNNSLENLKELPDGYLYTASSGTQEHYDSNNRLDWIKYPYSTVFLSYDSSDRLHAVTNGDGESLIFQYNAKNQIESLSTPDNTIYYGYDDFGNLTNVIYPEGTRIYNYSDPVNSESCATSIPDYTVSGYNPLSAIEGEEPTEPYQECPTGEECGERPEPLECPDGAETCEEISEVPTEPPACPEEGACEEPSEDEPYDVTEYIRDNIQEYAEDQAGEHMYEAAVALDRAKKAVEEGRYTDALKYYRDYAYHQSQVAIHIGSASTTLTLAPENDFESSVDLATMAIPVGPAARLGKKSVEGIVDGARVVLNEKTLTAMEGLIERGVRSIDDLLRSVRLVNNKISGNAARDAIVARYPGARSEVVLLTPETGNWRKIDVLTVEGRAIESKVGRVSLTQGVKKQILKDVELRNTLGNEVDAVTWEFKRSDVTGKIGPTEPLRQFLEENGIEIIIND